MLEKCISSLSSLEVSISVSADDNAMQCNDEQVYVLTIRSKTNYSKSSCFPPSSHLNAQCQPPVAKSFPSEQDIYTVAEMRSQT